MADPTEVLLARWAQTYRWHRPLSRQQRLCSHEQWTIVPVNRVRALPDGEWRDLPQRQRCLECGLSKPYES
jgi:rubredoxin